METLSIHLSNLLEVPLRCESNIPEGAFYAAQPVFIVPGLGRVTATTEQLP